MARTIQDLRDQMMFQALWNEDFFGQNARIDYALRTAGNLVANNTFCTVASATKATTADDNTLDMSATTGFQAAMVMAEPYIQSTDWRRLRIVSLENLRLENDLSSGTTGRPEMLAWTSPDTAILYPIPDAAYTIVFYHRAPFTVWKPGAQGTYAATTTYYEGDWVKDDDSASFYQSLYRVGTFINQAPPNTTYWRAITDVTALVNPLTQTINIPDRFVDEVVNVIAKRSFFRGVRQSHIDVPGEDEVQRVLLNMRGQSWDPGAWLPDPAMAIEDNYGGSSVFV
jgi:hypothetical protein